MTDKQSAAESELKAALSEQQVVPIAVVQANAELEQTKPAEAGTRFGLPQAGDIFAGRYKITHSLGAGGMSVVYAAQDLVLKSEVALKILLPRGANADKSNLRFQQEATTIAKLNHENIIKVMDLNVEQDFPYIVMELLPGTTLADVLKSGSLDAVRAIKLMIQACDALAHAHTRGVVHRDVKPGNFMLIDEGGEERLKLVDFGIAKLLAPDIASPSLTQTGETVGSPLYMSPEQCNGSPLDERCDVYALGCVMYESFTGRPPFLADSMFKVVMKHLSEEPKPITAIDSGQAYVASINAIVMKCLQKDPLERYSNVEQVRADLLKVLTGGSVRHDFKPIAIEQSSATQGSGTPIKLMPMAMEVSLHGFNLRQWAVIAAAFIFAFWLFRQVPHGGLIAIIAMIMVGSCTAAVVKGLALHSLTWWRSRLGLPIRLAPAYLPGVIINSIGTASDTTTKAKPSLIYRKFSRRQVAALPEERKHQLSLALVSLLPDLGRMQFFCSSFQDEGEQETQGDCYVVSSSPPGDSTTPDLLARQFNRSDVALNTVRQEESHSLVLLHSSGRCSQKDSSAASEDLSVVDAKELEQQSRSIKLDAQYCTSMTFTKLPAQVYFGWLKTLLDLPCRLALSVHMEPLDEVQAKKARQTQRWNQQLQLLVPESNFEVISNQPVNSAPIDVSIYVCVYADTIEQLNKDVALIQRTAGNLGGLLEIAEYRQADCFVSSLPLAHDQQKSRHRLLPSEAAALIPFE